ncbi:hypothetical protein CDD82_1796 [Ophiocordyceps australis]|uniref:Extracellular membrane protein CFEM domain-containing protein n=1 Tax=Ophiocordyceps australis TaxID=1399860 RepID=A0A2C5ZH86_9HYPO|nr:hypothetical protein CDD82_1796 [Ophiocordyceps australis]
MSVKLPAPAFLLKMRFFLPLALLTAAGVSAQDKDCLADYIVSRCLSSEGPKVNDCPASDWDCLCAAHEAVATCYNNCPNDPRAPAARGQVDNFCKNASVYGTRAHAKTSSLSSTRTSSDASATSTEAASATDGSSHSSSSSSRPTSTNAADSLVGSSGGFIMAAGLLAAIF